MCDPISIGAAVASAAGSAITGYENSQSQKAMVKARNAATEAELARQHGFQDQAGGVFNDALSLFSPQAVSDRLAAAKSGAGSTIQGNIPGDYGSINTRFAPNAAKAGEAKSIADLFGKSMDRSTNMGNLIGYDQFGFDNKLNLTGTGRQLDTISDFSGNSARVGGLEQEVNANNAYKPPSGLGDLLSIAGTLGGYYGGRGTTLPTKAAVSPAVKLW